MYDTCQNATELIAALVRLVTLVIGAIFYVITRDPYRVLVIIGAVEVMIEMIAFVVLGIVAIVAAVELNKKKKEKKWIEEYKEELHEYVEDLAEYDE